MLAPPEAPPGDARLAEIKQCFSLLCKNFLQLILECYKTSIVIHSCPFLQTDRALASDAGTSKADRLVELAAHHGVLRPRDLAASGIQAEYLRRACARGLIKKVGRGSYVLAQRQISSELQLEIAARAVPSGVICLRSALALYGCGSAPAAEVDMAIERHAAQPRLDFPHLRIARMGATAFAHAIVEQQLDGVQLRLYTLEKTLTDLFKFRNKLGPHLAVDGLRAALSQRRIDLAALGESARINRVERVMRPYVEALLRQSR